MSGVCCVMFLDLKSCSGLYLYKTLAISTYNQKSGADFITITVMTLSSEILSLTLLVGDASIP